MWALALAVLSVTALQVTGLKSALDLRGQNFNQNVDRSLNQVAEWIQVSADINFLGHNAAMVKRKPALGINRYRSAIRFWIGNI